jgi:signal transduction histidine kinase
MLSHSVERHLWSVVATVGSIKRISMMMSPPDTKALPEASSRYAGRIREPWLLLARGIWILLMLLLLINFVANVPAYYQSAGTGCILPNPGDCPTGQLTPGNIQALDKLHLSVVAVADFFATLTLMVSVLYWAVGLLIFWRKSQEWTALLFSLLCVTLGATGIYGFLNAQAPQFVQFLTNFTEIALIPPLGAVFLLTFPTGRFTPRWSWAVFVLFVVSTLPPVPLVASLPVYLLAIGVQIYRYRRVYDAVQRQQTRWFIFGLGVGFSFLATYYVLGAMVPGLSAPDSWYQLLNVLPWLLIWVILLLSVSIAILRYRLWDIDLIINRTLVYAGLSTGIIGVYVLVVAGLGSLLQIQGNPVLSLVAASLVAVFFQPLRAGLQQAINRLMYGERDAPYMVISRLGKRLEATVAPDAVLPSIVETVAQALKLPYAAIALQYGDEFSLTASYGTAKGELVRLPLVYQAERVGELLLAPRTPGESFSPADRRLLDDVARQSGVAAHAVHLTHELKRLTQDLQHARERLVSAREEERRRLRRDLHDGLGPQLSSQTLLLTSAQMLLRQDPDEAEAILKYAVTQSQQAISDIRRLVYALRPPALDDLGLVAAITEQLTQNRASGVVFSLKAPEPLPALPAAVEVACYRIVQEAITNVVRHAHARNCTVSLRCEEQLIIEVIDDGQGLPPAYRSGVGLNSMRERAEELGGSWQIEPGLSGGTRVQARLPYR